MRKGLTFTFIFGLLLGGMAALIFWYYQNSTSAEDGALVLLDKLANADRRLREMAKTIEAEGTMPSRIRIDSRVTEEVPSFLNRPTATKNKTEAEDLTEIKGIGPVFATRLREAGIQTVQALTAVSAEELANICQISAARAEAILKEAKT